MLIVGSLQIALSGSHDLEQEPLLIMVSTRCFLEQAGQCKFAPESLHIDPKQLLKLCL